MDGCLSSFVVLAETIQQNAPQVAGEVQQAAQSFFSWQSVGCGVIGAVGYAFVVPFFKYLLQRYGIEQKTRVELTDRAYNEGEKLRNDLMTEILENRKQVTSLQQENLKYQKENFEQKVELHRMSEAFAASRVEKDELRKYCDELHQQNVALCEYCDTLRLQLDKLGTATPTPPPPALVHSKQAPKRPLSDAAPPPPPPPHIVASAASQVIDLAAKAVDVAVQAASSAARSAQDAAMFNSEAAKSNTSASEAATSAAQSNVSAANLALTAVKAAHNAATS